MKSPMSLKPGEARLARIDAYAGKANLSRHGAILDLIDLGLESAEGGGKSPPASPKKVEPRVVAPGLKTANQLAEELTRRKEAEAERIRGWFTPAGKGKK